MRKTITGLAAALALAAVSAAPAMACEAYAPPCTGGLFTSGFGSHQGYGVERLPDPSYSYGPRYYYVNQGPLYSGPGNYAPVPTYQERAVTGWRSYDRGYYYGYNGGPYGDATSHYYDGMPNVQGPVVYRYHPRMFYRHGYRHSVRYGYRSARYGYASRTVLPRHGYAPRFYGPRAGMHGPRVIQVPGATARVFRPGVRRHDHY